MLALEVLSGPGETRLAPRSKVREYGGCWRVRHFLCPLNHLHVLQSSSAWPSCPIHPKHTLVRLGPARWRSRGARVGKPQLP